MFQTQAQPQTQEQPLALAADFPAVDRQRWRDLVEAVLAKGRTADRPVRVEDALASPTYDGFDRQALYTSADLAAVGGRPGVHFATERPARASWDVRVRYQDADPVRLNGMLLEELANGATSAWLDLSSQPDRQAESLPGYLDRALDGVPLERAAVVLDAGDRTEQAAAALTRLARRRGIAAEQFLPSLGADPIGQFVRTGRPPELALLDTLAHQYRDCPGARLLTVDASIYHDAGGSDSDCLAVATAVGVQYLRQLTSAGLDADAALAAMEFRFSVGADQFLSIAALRAARVMWNRIGELSGARTVAQRQHAVTAWAMLTRRDPWVNILRSTIACFAAATGGADAITVRPFDEAVGMPNRLGRRIARNTSAVLHDEASLARVEDPAGGSYYVESLTGQLAEQAWAKFTAIERAGGALAAVRSGLIGGMLAATAVRRQARIARGGHPITGVSEFAFLDEDPLQREPGPPPEPGGLFARRRYAEDFEDLRDRSDALTASRGTRPVVVLMAVGSDHSAATRLDFAAALLAVAGIRTLITTVPDPSSLSELAQLFTATAAPVAMLCAGDADHAALAAPTVRALRAAGAEQVWLAGQVDPASEPAWSADGQLYPGCDAVDALSRLLTALEAER